MSIENRMPRLPMRIVVCFLVHGQLTLNFVALPLRASQVAIHSETTCPETEALAITPMAHLPALTSEGDRRAIEVRVGAEHSLAQAPSLFDEISSFLANPGGLTTEAMRERIRYSLAGTEIVHWAEFRTRLMHATELELRAEFSRLLAANPVGFQVDPKANLSLDEWLRMAHLTTPVMKIFSDLMPHRRWRTKDASLVTILRHQCEQMTLLAELAERYLLQAQPRPQESAHSNPRLLIADDKEYVRDAVAVAITECLGDLNPRNVLTADGISAVAHFVEGYLQNSPFDLVITDGSMTIWGGYEATEAIRAFEKSRGMNRTPIVMVTSDPDRSYARQVGIDAVHLKGTRFADLGEMVRAYLNGYLDRRPQTRQTLINA